MCVVIGRGTPIATFLLIVTTLVQADARLYPVVSICDAAHAGIPLSLSGSARDRAGKSPVFDMRAGIFYSLVRYRLC